VINDLSFKNRQRGVTLLEMMIALAVSAIVLTLVAPNVQEILTKNRITAEVNEMSGLLQFARFTSIDQRANTVLCPSANFETCNTDWNGPKIVFIDENGNDDRDADEPLLLSSQNISRNNVMTSSADLYRFLDIGGTDTPGTITLCPRDGEEKFARALFISLQGRSRISVDSNDDGIHEDADDNNLDC
jgi:type IV fimbrial biogenesis protein FimT